MTCSRESTIAIAASHAWQRTKGVVHALGLSIALASTAQAATTYRITLLDALPGGSYSTAGAINEAGLVVGSVGLPSGSSAALWQAGSSTPVQLAGVANAIGWAAAVNTYGNVVGSQISNQALATLWTAPYPNSTFVLRQEATATGINDSAQIVGTINGTQAMIWQGGAISPLAQLQAGYNTSAQAINNAGQVAGQAARQLSPQGWTTQRAVIWQADGSITELPILAGYPDASALSLNESGAAVGYSISSWSSYYTHATLWSGDQAIDLGLLAGDMGSKALDINNQGAIVGISTHNVFDYQSRTSALLWAAGSTEAIDLNTLVDGSDPLKSLAWLSTASGINNRGQIVGTALVDGKTLGYVLTPVPEPGMLALTGCGLLLTLCAARRRRAGAAH